MKSPFLSAQLFILFLLFASCSNPSNYGTTNLENSMFRVSPMHNGVSSARSFLNVDIKWKFRTDGAIRGSASMNTSTLFIGSGDGHLYAVDKVLGKEYWKFKTEGAVYSTPALYKGLVIFTSRDNHLYAVSQSDGELIWKVKMYGMPAVNRCKEAKRARVCYRQNTHFIAYHYSWGRVWFVKKIFKHGRSSGLDGNDS